jgi:hypothetical protein
MGSSVGASIAVGVTPDTVLGKNGSTREHAVSSKNDNRKRVFLITRLSCSFTLRGSALVQVSVSHG